VGCTNTKLPPNNNNNNNWWIVYVKLAVLYQNFTPTPGEALSLSLSLSLYTHNLLLLCNNKLGSNKMGLAEISKWAKWVFF
jgi:hypothetical protein